MVTLSLVITGWGAKSTTCSFKITRFATRSMKGILKWTPTDQVSRYAPRRSTTRARAVRDDLVIHKGETVIVKEIRGVKLMVDRISEGE